MNWKTAFSITGALLAVVLTTVVRAGPEQGAEAVIVEATREIYDAIHKQCGVIAKNPLHLHTLVEEILIPHADCKRMGRLALGKQYL